VVFNLVAGRRSSKSLKNSFRSKLSHQKQKAVNNPYPLWSRCKRTFIASLITKMVSLNLLNFDLERKTNYWAVSLNHCPNRKYLYQEYDSSH
jgi:hypothetical protein